MRFWAGRIENDFATRVACAHKLTAYYEHIHVFGFEHYAEITITNSLYVFFFCFSPLLYLCYE